MMRSIWVALVLMLVYLVVMFIMLRILDLVTWYQQGISPTDTVDPIVLSVRQLKQLLELRGISYAGYIEKRELAELVQSSAPVLEGELSELEVGSSEDGERQRLVSAPPPAQFTGSAHFYEQVEDTKDSIWLVQVVPAPPAKHVPLLDDYGWRVVRNQVAPFAIRTGLFDCRLDRRLCQSKGWLEPLLLLALPRGIKPKDKVVTRTCRLTRPLAILEWLREELSIRVHKIADVEELQTDWLAVKDASNSSTSTSSPHHEPSGIDIKMLLITHLLHPPLFFTALSIKFTGRIRFGMLTVKKGVADSLGGESAPSYMLVTPERTVVYGRRRKEHYNLCSMNAYLRSIHPEMNDVFLATLVFVNMLATLRLLQMPVDYLWWKWAGLSLWTLTAYNLWLFCGWLVAVGAWRWPSMVLLWHLLTTLTRRLALTDLAALVHADWCCLMCHPVLTAASFMAFSVAVTRHLRRHHGVQEGGRQPSQPAARPWWEVDCLFRSPITPTPPVSLEVELEEGIELLIQRLAVPNLWLQPTVPTDYVKELPIWKHRVRPTTKETIRRLMDSDVDPDWRKILLPNEGEVCGWSTATNSETGQSDEEDSVEANSAVGGECPICLEAYRIGVWLCQLPCGHFYHKRCIMVWLQRDNHHCPVCRWPAYKAKHPHPHAI